MIHVRHEILTPRSIAERMHSMPEWLMLTPNASMLVALRLRLKQFSGFWLRDLEKYAHHGTKQNIQHQKEKWCEALSLKSDRPYYVDFSVFDRSGKVSKSRNSEKFSKELWFMWVTPWNEACLKKQSYMISSGCMLRDFSKLPQSEVKNMISDFLNDADFNFFPEL